MPLEFLTKWEPVWLLVLLAAELIYSIRIHTMAKIEFEYDKEWNERKAARRKKYEKTKNIGNETSISNQTNLEQKQGTPGNP